MLRNILTRPVPELAAKHATRLLADQLPHPDVKLTRADLTGWILHAGGREVLIALQKSLELEDAAMQRSATVLREYGNVSSPFVCFVLEKALAEAAPGGWWWVSSFGAGFSCHGAFLKVA
jgi:alkylresorcinol/alkylpyrone synthase